MNKLENKKSIKSKPISKQLSKSMNKLENKKSINLNLKLRLHFFQTDYILT
jgi:hypothetical protein